MKHHVFALFDTHAAAERAVHEIHMLDAPGHRVSIIMHRDRLEEADIGFTETHAWHGLSLGALYGAGAGVIIGGLVAGPMGLFGAGPLATAALGAGTGSLLGGLGGALSGAGDPDHDLERLAEGLAAGKVLLNVTGPNRRTTHLIGRIMAEHGGEVVHSRGLRPAA
ncbi:MAG: hypothetical protein EP329_27330 [Deltaproteobacteria bacterium]|nr:MAG: hypothetical protein EP329_27330 [Deltaproteobacteria bacterium]